MQKLLLGLLASALTVGFLVVAQPVRAEYLDSAEIGTWSKPAIDFLTAEGILVGYPDGTFKPAENITREELAVALMKAMFNTEAYLQNVIYSNDEYLYNEIVNTQIQLLEALIDINELKAKELLENNNFIALGLGYGVSNSDTDDVSNIQLMAKVQVIELSDTFAVSVRPFVTTDGTGGATVTLDTDLSDTFTVYAGGGVAANWSNGGQLTGSGDVAGIINGGLEVNLSKDTVTGIDVKLATDGEEQWNPVVTGFVGVKF